MNIKSSELIQIWKSLRETGHYKEIVIAPEIRESWKRSELYGVDPCKPYCDVILSETELAERKTNNSALLEQATVMMGHLHKFTEGSGFAFALSDSEDFMLKIIGDQEALEFMSITKLIEGTGYSERIMGTSSLSLAHLLEKPFQLHGYEHFYQFSTLATASSSPIFSRDGTCIGVLSVVGKHQLVHRHTLGMVVAASRAIERQMALRDAYRQSEVDNLNKTTIMESMSDGVLSLDREGRVTQINRLAARQLGIDCKTAVGKKLRDIMLPENEFLFSKICTTQKMVGEPLIIRRNNDMAKMAVTCSPLTSHDAGVLGTVVILQPMQQYKRLIERASGARAKITFDNIIGQSIELQNAIKTAQMAAKSDSNVLLWGESGVGKEMFAQSIHNASNRFEEPFFAINCAALPRELISSEFFGYEEGAFTGARKGGNPGKFELADQGTIFLDEIGEMPIDLQGSLLRFLEEGTVIRLGGREIIPVNVRIIAATNKNLQEEVKKSNFRMDLYYRLEVIDINIPALRDRRDDIPDLVEFFIKIIGPKLGKVITGIDSKAMDFFLHYDWPGNVRELSNLIERAINMNTGDILTLDSFPPEMQKTNQELSSLLLLRTHKELVEEQLIIDCLRKHKNNKSLTAKELGISRTSLYRKLAKYSIA